MNTTINSYHPSSHFNQVLAIFQKRPDIFPESEINQIKIDLKHKPSANHHMIVATDNNIVLGYCGTFFNNEHKNWYLDWFSVHPQYLHQGIGKKLLTSIVDWLKIKTVIHLFVETCSCTGEANARCFYESQGFIQDSIVIDGYAPGHSKITYIKTL